MMQDMMGGMGGGAPGPGGMDMGSMMRGLMGNGGGAGGPGGGGMPSMAQMQGELANTLRKNSIASGLADIVEAMRSMGMGGAGGGGMPGMLHSLT